MKETTPKTHSFHFWNLANKELHKKLNMKWKVKLTLKGVQNSAKAHIKMNNLLKFIKTLVLFTCLGFCSYQSYHEIALYFKYQIFTASNVVEVDYAPIHLVFCDSVPIENQVSKRCLLYILIMTRILFLEHFCGGNISKTCMACTWSTKQLQHGQAPDTLSWNLYSI